MFTLLKNFLCASVLLGLSAIAIADDIDIVEEGSLKDVNVLFVMDLSGSMNWSLTNEKKPKGGDPSRLDVLRNAFQTIVADKAFNETNFGLSVFSGDAINDDGKGVAHGIAFPVSPLIGKSAQDSLNANSNFTHKGTSYMPAVPAVSAPDIYNTRKYLSLLSADTTIWDAGGSTPIVDALYEATQYFRAGEVKKGRFPADDVRSAHPSTYAGSLSASTSTVTPACTAADLLTVPKGTIGSSCTTSYVNETRTDNTAGLNCVVNTGNTATCAEGTSSCGFGTNCALQLATPVSRVCETANNTIASCMTAHPSYHSCVANTDAGCAPNDEGQTVCNPSTTVICKEDIALYQCDAATCDFPVETCTKCPDDIIKTNVNGSATYTSPIVSECPNNGIILLTDGEPTVNNAATDVATLISTYAKGCDVGSDDGRCGPELVDFLYNEDQADGSTVGANNVPGEQNVATYPIGLALDSKAESYMQKLADKGQGKPAGKGVFINATSGSELTAAFKNALMNIAKSKARSFSSPSYSIDTSTLLTHGDYVYVPVFDQDATGWPGNLKKYKLVNGVLTDANNIAAIDADGALIDTATDFWSSTTTSDDAVLSGGAANKLAKPKDRKLYTDIGLTAPTFPADLTAYKLKDSNNFIDKLALGDASMTDDYRKDLLKFIRGEKKDGSRRNFMGDIIHSKAVQLQMSNGRKLIFVGSNEGYLHAFNDYADVTNSKNGTEAFAFMPGKLLKNIKRQFTNDSSNGHIYGVDSPITVWIDERTSTDPAKVDNGILDAGEKAYLFFGLRRGGNFYYALEVTNPDEPKLVWRKDTSSTGFEALANTWSQPVMTMLKWKNTQTEPKPVLIFGGGYSEDPITNIEVPNLGNAVYIVDAITGDKVWSTKKAEESSTYSPDGAIANAIPSRIRVLDVDRNGSADRLYFGDTGGNIWRVDLNDSNFDPSTADDIDITKAKLYKFASLGGTAPSRKFFEEPDVAIFRQGGQLVTTIAMGSGSRPTPLEVASSDKFFVLYDKEVIGARTDSTLTWPDSGLINSSSLTPADTLKAGYKGWYKNLADAHGEKVLSTAITYQNKVMFTTFQTAPVAANQCGPTNSSRLYIMDLRSGVVDVNSLAAKNQILGTPQIVIESLQGSGTGGACTVGDCKPKRAVRIGGLTIPLPLSGGATTNSLPRVYWIDN